MATLSIIISPIIAIVSVILTIYLQNRRDRLRSLRALRVELEMNKGLADTIVEDMSDVLEHREDNIEQFSFLQQFDTSAFGNMKDGGHLKEFSPEFQRQLLRHYVSIAIINDRIKYRSRLYGFSSSSGWEYSDEQWQRYNKELLGVETMIVSQTLTLLDEKSKDELKDESQSEFLSLNLETALGEAITFEEVDDLLETKIKNYPIMKRL